MNKAISAVIIEDEIPASRLLHSMLLRLRPEWQTEVLPGSVEDASKWFDTHPHPDLIFLDIQLADGDSFEFLSKVRPSSFIIFTTAYDQYAIRAFSVNSIDYILKPVEESRLLDAIIKFEKTSSHVPNYLETVLYTLRAQNKLYRTRFLINTKNQYKTLQVNEVAFFYSENKITYAVDYSGGKFCIDLTLDNLYEQLNPDDFFRANRQIILGVKSIKKIEPYFNGKVIVNTSPEAPIPITVSREKVSTFKAWLNY